MAIKLSSYARIMRDLTQKAVGEAPPSLVSLNRTIAQTRIQIKGIDEIRGLPDLNSQTETIAAMMSNVRDKTMAASFNQQLETLSNAAKQLRQKKEEEVKKLEKSEKDFANLKKPKAQPNQNELTKQVTQLTQEVQQLRSSLITTKSQIDNLYPQVLNGMPAHLQVGLPPRPADTTRFGRGG